MGVIAEYKKVVEFLEQKANFDPFSTGFGTTSQDDFLGEYQQLPDEDLGSSDVDYWKNEEEAGECKARQKSAGISDEDLWSSEEEAGEWQARQKPAGISEEDFGTSDEEADL